MSLTDAIHLGLRDNRAIRSAYLARIAQKFDSLVAEDRFTPKLLLAGRQVSGRTDAGSYRQSQIAPVVSLLSPIGTRFSLAGDLQFSRSRNNAYNSGAILMRSDAATLVVTQPLLRGAGYDVTMAAVRLARLGEQANRLNLKNTVARTITQIIVAYRELLRTQERLRIARESLARSRQLLDVNRALIEAGRMAVFDIVQTEADVVAQELNVEDAANQLDASRLALLQLLALDLHARLGTVELPEAQRAEISLSQALRQAREHEPIYLSQRIADEQARLNLLVARNNRLWDVSLVGGLSRNRTGLNSDAASSANRHWNGYAGIQIEIQFGDLSRRQQEVRAKVDADNQAILLAESEQTLERNVGDAVRELGARWRQYEIALRARDLTRRKLQIEQDKLRVGRSSNFQVLSFEADLRNAENARLNALITYLNTQTQLDLTLGTTLERWEIALND
ncbi:TolC family protein [Cupriavidus ulmosensis]